MLFGCAQSGYQQFYNPYIDPQSDPDLVLLAPNEEPQVFGSDDFNRDINILRAKNYVLLGESAFNGGYEDTKNAVAQAKKLGATMVLTSSKYINTTTHTSMLFLPNNETTYHSGSVYAGGNTGGYSGTSTTYSTTAVPYTTQQDRYEQHALFFAKTNKKIRFGVYISDLSPELRVEIERNTGALIEIVSEDSPAFYANIFAGDILISIDGVSVINAQHAGALLLRVPDGQAYSDFVVIRKGEEKTIRLKL